MRSAVQMLGGVAVAGVVAAGSTAFTATGLTNSAGASQFIGGTVTQTVTGATLTGVTYSFGDVAKTKVRSVVLAFTGADGKTATVVPAGGGGTPWDVSTVATASSYAQFRCTAGTIAPGDTVVAADATGAIASNSITCVATKTSDDLAIAATDGFVGLTGLAITVA